MDNKLEMELAQLEADVNSFVEARKRALLAERAFLLLAKESADPTTKRVSAAINSRISVKLQTLFNFVE